MPGDLAEDFLGRGAEIDGMQLVGGDMVVAIVAAPAVAHDVAVLRRDREEVGAAGAESGGGLAAKHDFIRKLVTEGRVLRRSADALGALEHRILPNALALVVEADHIHLGR